MKKMWKRKKGMTTVKKKMMKTRMKMMMKRE